MKKKPEFNQVQREAKILLAKSIIKNWGKNTEKEIENAEKKLIGSLVKNSYFR